ncbi:hypothetical protein BJX64DRAFT_176776 [Aspergillus heterothallicus]
MRIYIPQRVDKHFATSSKMAPKPRKGISMWLRQAFPQRISGLLSSLPVKLIRMTLSIKKVAPHWTFQGFIEDSKETACHLSSRIGPPKLGEKWPRFAVSGLLAAGLSYHFQSNKVRFPRLHMQRAHCSYILRMWGCIGCVRFDSNTPTRMDRSILRCSVSKEGHQWLADALITGDRPSLALRCPGRHPD